MNSINECKSFWGYRDSDLSLLIQHQAQGLLCVKAGYNATLDIVSPSIYPGAQPIQLTGHVQYKAGNVIKNLLGNVVPLSIDITSKQTTRKLSQVSRDGTFSTVFYPARAEYGTYTARARHPSSVLQFMVQTEWQFLGMKAIPQLIQLNGETIGNYESTFYNTTMVIMMDQQH